MSNGFHFFVGQLPEVNEVEPNDDFAKAQTLPALPVLVNGQINRQVNGQPAADKDFFRFEAKAGQTLVFTVDARAILPYMADAVPGWLQAVLTLYDANGKELAYADGFRFKQDTVLIYKVPADGQYVLESARLALPRTRGFRLPPEHRNATVHHRHLPAGRQARNDRARAVARREPGAADDECERTGRHAASLMAGDEGQGLASNRVKFDAGDLPETSEVEPNDTPQQANRVNIGSIVNGRIGKPGDLDYFVFKAAAQQNAGLRGAGPPARFVVGFGYRIV